MRTLLTLCLVLSLPPAAAEGQARWAAGLSLDAALPAQDLGDTSLDIGFGFEGALAYRLVPHFWVDGGWGWHRFSEEDGGSGNDVEETGYTFGLRFEHPFVGEEGGLSYLLRAGGTYNHIEVEDADGELVADSGHGLGWDLGLGVVFPLGDAWALTPTAQYRSLARDLPIGPETLPVELEYVTLRVTVSKRF